MLKQAWKNGWENFVLQPEIFGMILLLYKVAVDVESVKDMVMAVVDPMMPHNVPVACNFNALLVHLALLVLTEKTVYLDFLDVLENLVLMD
jgi:hypothetical protein